MYYSRYKHWHDFKFQTVIISDDLLFSLFNSVIESSDDWYLFQQNSIEKNIKKLFDNVNISEEEWLYIYEDSAYIESSAIMRVYKRFHKDQLTAARKKFNKKMSIKWVLVEHKFEFVQKYWARTAFYLISQADLSSIETHYLTVCLLSNIMIYLQENQISEFFSCSFSLLKQYFVSAAAAAAVNEKVVDEIIETAATN